MKSKINKDLIVLFVLIPLFLFGAFYISNKWNKRLPAYSVTNKSKSGCSVFFEALKELNYSVYKVTDSVESLDTKSIQIIGDFDQFNINNREVKTWIEKGGTLFYLTPKNIGSIDYGVKPKVKGNIKIYKYHKGSLITSDIDFITNKSLIKNTDGAYEILNEIDNHYYKAIYFNEGHLFKVKDAKTMWDYVSIEFKFIIYQLLIVLTAFFCYKGKIFGKPIPLYEEVEREENEYLYSTAALYKQAKCWDLIFENYYKSFLGMIKKSNEEWLLYWKKEELPNLSKAEGLYEFVNTNKRNIKVKQYIQMINTIELLKNILSKRSDSYWKTLM